MSVKTSGQPVWQIVARREIAVRATDKSTLIGTAVMLAVIVGALGFSAWNASKEKTYDLAYSSTASQAMVEGIAERASDIDEKVRIVPVAVDDADAARHALEEEQADAYLRPDTDGWTLVTLEDADSELRDVVSQSVEAIVLAGNADAAGTTAAELTEGSAVGVEQLEGDSELSAIRWVVGYALAIVFYFASIMFGMAIATSVVEEKQSRVVEILVSAVPLRQLLAGKVLGNTLLALGQMVLFVGVGLVGMAFTSYAPQIGLVAASAGWFLVFFVAGFAALACLWAVAGSLATRSEDLQSTTPVLTTILMVAMFVGLFGEGTVRVVGSYLPVVSAISMPQRLLAGEAAWWEPILSLLVTVAFAAWTMVIGERLYRRSILNTGRRLGVREALKVEA